MRTVMRWERLRALPVHRLPGGAKAGVYALRSELEAWKAARPPKPGDESEAGRRVRGLVLVALTMAVLAWALWYGVPRFVARPSGGAVAIRSLAVLPFENLTGDAAQEYFADGIHDALITELARLGGVRVIARTSVMRYRGTRKTVKEIARELDVDALVEGSVLRLGERVRITAQLVEGRSEGHLWSASYERDVRDVLALLSEVSGSVVDEIGATVAEGRGTASGSPRTQRPVRPEAYEAYLLAQHAARLLDRRSLSASLPLYQKATDLDPGFAAPWGGIAFVQLVQATRGYVPPKEALRGAREALRRGMALDDRLASAQCSQGLIALYWDWDFAAAGKVLERAIGLNPSDSCLRQAYADYLLLTGRADEGLEQGRVGRRYDPLWPAAHYLVVYQAVAAHRYDEAIAEGWRMLDSFPEKGIAHWPIGLALWLQGRHDEALVEWRPRPNADEETIAEWGARFGEDHGCFRRLEAAYRRGGRVAGLSALAECTSARAVKGEVRALDAAIWYAAAGEREPAFEWLERSYDRREPFLLFISVNPLFDPIRSDPRFETLLRRIGLRRADQR